MQILVVEDDPAIAAMLERGIRAEGYEVVVSNDGEDAIWRAQEADYGAIVLDLLLPKVNGYKVCQQLREAGDRTPILVLTAKNGDLDEIEMLDLGADDFLTKPVRYGVLMARLRTLLRRNGDRATNTMAVGAFRYDERSHTCTFAGDPLDLTPRERSLLHVLLCGAGQPVSKQSVLDQVWGPDFDGEPNIVDVYLGRLRAKVGFDAIETVRGVGYRIQTNTDPNRGP